MTANYRQVKKVLILLCLSLILVASAGTVASCKTVSKTRYINRTVHARKSNGQVKLKRNTKVRLQFKGKKKAVVEYRRTRYVVPSNSLSTMRSPKKYTGRQLRRGGVIKWKGIRFTWYSQRVLPGRGLKIPGRHVDKQGFVCDKYGYIVVASTVKMKLKHRIVPTPFGKFGRCYDCGGGGSKWRDVYTNF